MTRKRKDAGPRRTREKRRRPQPLLLSAPRAAPGVSPNAHGCACSPARQPQQRSLALRGPRGGAGRRPSLWPRRGGTMGPHPGAGGREAACAPASARSPARYCGWSEAEAGASGRAGERAGGRAGRGGAGRDGGVARIGAWRREEAAAAARVAGGRAAGTRLVNKLRCCLGLAGPGAAAAAAAPERRCRAPAAAHPSASAPASRALARL